MSILVKGVIKFFRVKLKLLLEHLTPVYELKRPGKNFSQVI